MVCTLEELRDGESVTLYSTNSRSQIVAALMKLGATSSELKRLTVLPIGGAS